MAGTPLQVANVNDGGGAVAPTVVPFVIIAREAPNPDAVMGRGPMALVQRSLLAKTMISSSVGGDGSVVAVVVAGTGAVVGSDVVAGTGTGVTAGTTGTGVAGTVVTGTGEIGAGVAGTDVVVASAGAGVTVVADERDPRPPGSVLMGVAIPAKVHS